MPPSMPPWRLVSVVIAGPFALLVFCAGAEEVVILAAAHA